MKNRKLKVFASCVSLLGLTAIGGLSIANSTSKSFSSTITTNFNANDIDEIDLTYFVVDSSKVKTGKVGYIINGDDSITIAAIDSRSGVDATDIEFKSSLTIAGINHPITTIGKSAFEGCLNLTGKVTFSSATTEIDASAFTGSKISEIDLTKATKLKKLGDHCFQSCTNLATANLPLDVTLTNFGAYAFANNEALTDLVLPTSLTEIPEHLCTGNTILASPVFNENITKIGAFAYAECPNITTISLPKNLTYIGQSAFQFCSNITSKLELPSQLNYLGNHAFEGCSGIPGELVLPSSLDAVGDNAFKDCTGFKSILISYGIESIGNNAFEGCVNLAGELQLPNTLTTIRNEAFKNCSKLTGSLYMPSKIAVLGELAFEGCTFDHIQFASSTIPTFNTNWQPTVTQTPEVYVPYGSKTNYVGANNIGFTEDQINDGLMITKLRISHSMIDTILDDGSETYICSTLSATIQPGEGIDPNIDITWTVDRPDKVKLIDGNTTKSGQPIRFIGIEDTAIPVEFTAKVSDPSGKEFTQICEVNINFEELKDFVISVNDVENEQQINGHLLSTDTIKATLPNNVDPNIKVSWELLQTADTNIGLEIEGGPEDQKKVETFSEGEVTVIYKQRTTMDQFLLIQVTAEKITKYCYVTVNYARAETISISGGSTSASGDAGMKGKLENKFSAKITPTDAFQQASWSITSTETIPTWIAIDSEGLVYWNSLCEDGTYKFKVKATSGDGSLSTESDEITITIGSGTNSDWMATFVPMICIVIGCPLAIIGCTIFAWYASKPDKKIYFLE